MADRPAHEIEITPEMIDVGVKALEAGLLEECSLPNHRPQLVREVWVAMYRAAKSHIAL